MRLNSDERVMKIDLLLRDGDVQELSGPDGRPCGGSQYARAAVDGALRGASIVRETAATSNADLFPFGAHGDIVVLHKWYTSEYINI